MKSLVAKEYIYLRLSFSLLFCAALVPAVLGQQVTPSPTPQIGSAQQAYEGATDFNRRVPMRDRTELSADVYRPKTPGRFPVILNRTPYTKTSASNFKIAQYLVAHGYIVVFMDVRGRGDSDGNFEPYRNDAQDGYDTIEWCAAQQWSTGKIGTLGGSYNGAIQWLNARKPTTHLATLVD